MYVSLRPMILRSATYIHGVCIYVFMAWYIHGILRSAAYIHVFVELQFLDHLSMLYPCFTWFVDKSFPISVIAWFMAFRNSFSFLQSFVVVPRWLCMILFKHFHPLYTRCHGNNKTVSPVSTGTSVERDMRDQYSKLPFHCRERATKSVSCRPCCTECHHMGPDHTQWG